MSNRPSSTKGSAHHAPLDHLRPGARRDNAEASDAHRESEPPPPASPAGAEPADPATPGAGKGEAERGKATGSPAAVATRPHLEGSNQNPR
jgi:hypothetical protein